MNGDPGGTRSAAALGDSRLKGTCQPPAVARLTAVQLRHEPSNSLAPAQTPPALLLTRLFIIFQEAVAGRRRQPMASAVVLTAERRRPMGDEGGPRRSRAALEHDIICLHAAA